MNIDFRQLICDKEQAETDFRKHIVSIEIKYEIEPTRAILFLQETINELDRIDKQIKPAPHF